jgi:hypothetical protein
VSEILILRLIHIVAGAVWVGAAIFVTFLLMPVLGGLGPTAGAVMAGLQKKGLFVVLPVLAILTILSGLRLIWIVSGGFNGSYFATPAGATYAVAGGTAILAFVLGFTLSRPLGARMGALAAQLGQAGTEDEKARLGRELAATRQMSTRVGYFVTALLFVATAGMAVARYL